MLKKIYRLRKKNDFAKVSQEGQTAYAPVFLIRYVKNDLNMSRFGLIVSTKVSKKATQRNLIRRRLSELIRLNISSIKNGYDIIIILSPKIINKQGKVLEYKKMGEILSQTLFKAKLLV
ncbi:MAG: ribonuclease P protein component [Patescibacteria group bacterium]